jgi:hypothetical protein
MNITMLRNAASKYGCKLMEGETGEVDDKLAEELIADRIAVVAVAEPAKADEKSVKAVAKTPAIKGE